MTKIHQERLPNGLWLVGEEITGGGVQSLAMAMLLPAGVAQEPADRQGVSAILSEMIFRGAGGLSSREHSDALDRLGVQRSTNVETHHLRITASMIGSKVREALPLLLDMATRPNLSESDLGPSRDLCLQELAALDDEPQDRSMLELRQRHYPQPLGRSPLGTAEGLEAVTLDDVRGFWKRACVPDGAILSFAGRMDWSAVKAQVEELLGDWRGSIEPATPQASPRPEYHHLHDDTAQVHIALAYDAVPEPHEHSMLQRAATAVLSGGMSGRLFTEVREKRGLVYSVYAMYAGGKDRGAIMSYAGTTTPRAQETLEVLEGELRRLCDGVTPDEFDRAIVGMRSRLVMQGESTNARANAIAGDQWLRGRPRALEEVQAEVAAITPERLNAFVRDNPPGEMTIVTIGPQPLRATAQAAGSVEA